MGWSVHSVSVSRRQSGLVPSQAGAGPAAARVTLTTQSSVPLGLTPVLLNAHQRSGPAPGPTWFEQEDVPSPASWAWPVTICRGGATLAGHGGVATSGELADPSGPAATAPSRCGRKEPPQAPAAAAKRV